MNDVPGVVTFRWFNLGKTNDTSTKHTSNPKPRHPQKSPCLAQLNRADALGNFLVLVLVRLSDANPAKHHCEPQMAATKTPVAIAPDCAESITTLKQRYV